MKKWEKYYNLPEIEAVRKLVTSTYSNKLKFIEESHQYFLDGVEYDCVSHITHAFKKKTTRQMAEDCYHKWQKYQDPSYKYYGKSVDEILQMWKENSSTACEYGTEAHEFAEGLFHYYTGNDDKIPESAKDAFATGVPMPRTPMEVAAMKLYDDLPENYIPVLAETKVFNKPLLEDKEEQAYAGTFDILFYYVKAPNDPANGLLVFDWKTNGSTNEDPTKAYTKLYENFKGETLAFPFEDMLDSDYSFYVLQLACYQIPLENLGLKVAARRLFWLHPNGEYDKIMLPNIADKMRTALNIPEKEQCIKRYLAEFKDMPVYEDAKAKMKKYSHIYKPPREEVAKGAHDFSCKKSIGDCSWLYKALSPTDYKDFYEKYITYNGEDDNPWHRGRSVDELYEMALAYKEACHDNSVTVGDCFHDLIMHIIIETIDGHKKELEAKQSFENSGYTVTNCTGKLDSEFNIDLATYDSDDMWDSVYQIKPTSTFIGDNKPDLLSDRINFFDKQKKFTAMYGHKVQDSAIKYLIYDKRDGGWLINPNTDTSVFTLEELVNPENGYMIIQMGDCRKNKEIMI